MPFDDEMPEDMEIELEIIESSLCHACRYADKCKRCITLEEVAQELECNAFEMWEIDLSVSTIVNECKRFAPIGEQEGDFMDFTDNGGKESNGRW